MLRSALAATEKCHFAKFLKTLSLDRINFSNIHHRPSPKERDFMAQTLLFLVSKHDSKMFHPLCQSVLQIIKFNYVLSRTTREMFRLGSCLNSSIFFCYLIPILIKVMLALHCTSNTGIAPPKPKLILGDKAKISLA